MDFVDRVGFGVSVFICLEFGFASWLFRLGFVCDWCSCGFLDFTLLGLVFLSSFRVCLLWMICVYCLGFELFRAICGLISGVWFSLLVCCLLVVSC